MQTVGLPPLFRLIWPLDGDRDQSFSDDEWRAIETAAAQHRLRPLLHRRLTQDGFAVPKDIADGWHEASKRSAKRAMQQRVELSRILHLLGEAGISAHVLKGGALCWRGWFDPAVRPMRDLDLLLSHDEAERAHQILRAKGFSGDEPDTALDVKHLPPLESTRASVCIELHRRVIDPANASWRRRDDIFREVALARAPKAPPGGLPVFADGDTLLHVILHGVLDHQFNNGPLLIFDMLQLISHGEIDWFAFWDLAARLEVIRAVQLALALAQTVDPALPLAWCGYEPIGMRRETVENAAAMMLVDTGRGTGIGFIGRIARFGLREQPGQLLAALKRRRGQANGKDRNKLEAYQGNIAQGRHVVRSVAVANWLRGGAG